MPGADIAAVDDVAAHLRQHRLQGGEQRVAGTNHEGQGAGRSATGTTGHRCIGQVDALFGRSSRYIAGRLRVDGAAVNHRGTGLDTGQHTVFVEVHTAHVGSSWQHGDHQLALLRGVARRAADLPTELGKFSQHGLVQVEQVQLMPGLDQVAGHGRAHVAQADECDTHDVLLSAG
ncbi:hypothetical protein D3C81_1212190 [compost metagenome]